jgi:hypothetical protein
MANRIEKKYEDILEIFNGSKTVCQTRQGFVSSAISKVTLETYDNAVFLNFDE